LKDRRDQLRYACLGLLLANLLADVQKTAFFKSEGIEKFFEDWCESNMSEDIRIVFEEDLFSCFMATLLKNTNKGGK